MILSTTVLDMNKWERRKIRQRALEKAVHLDRTDRRHRSIKMAEAKMAYDRFLASLREQRRGR